MAIGIYSNSTNATLYVLSFAAPYHWLLFALLAWGIVRAVWRVGASREAEASCSQAGLIRKLLTPQSLGVFRWSNYLLLALVVVYPLFRCFFSLPYIFCHVCPRKCVFGFLRPYLIPAALIMNMERQQWCTQACPLGTMQDAQTRLAASNKVLPRFWKVLPYAVLLFTLVIYFKVLGDYRHTTQSLMDAFTFFFRNEYSPHVLVIMALLILLGVAWRYQRPFCSLLCPLGACSSLIARIGKSISHQDLPKNIASGDTKNG
jgi:polyferredoxin